MKHKLNYDLGIEIKRNRNKTVDVGIKKIIIVDNFYLINSRTTTTIEKFKQLR